MSEAFIVEAVRTPVGRRGGGLSPDPSGRHRRPRDPRRSWSARRSTRKPSRTSSSGASTRSGRRRVTSPAPVRCVGGLPEHVPGVTIDRQCGSAQQAVHFAAQAVMSGTMDVVIAGGVQNMSQVPILASARARSGRGVQPVHQLAGLAHDLRQRRGQPVRRRRDDGRQVGPHPRRDGGVRRRVARAGAPGAGRRVGSTTRSCRSTASSATRGHANRTGTRSGRCRRSRRTASITAAVASQISDGSAAMLIMNERAVEEHGVTPRARIHHMSVWADDPIMMLSAPIPATQRALAKTGLKASDIDLVEINEAFAPVPMAWLRETDFEHEQINVNGGAIALGHPLGCHRRAPDDHAAERARAHRWPLRPPDDVRGRRPGQRHDHRASLIREPRCRTPEHGHHRPPERQTASTRRSITS